MLDEILSSELSGKINEENPLDAHKSHRDSILNDISTFILFLYSYDLLFCLGLFFILFYFYEKVISFVNFRYLPKFSYYFSYGCYIVLTLVTSLVYIPIFIPTATNPANVRKIKPVASFISKLAGIKWELRRGEILSVDRAAVVVGNHQSLFDALGIAMITPELLKCVAIMRKEIFYFWPFGLSAWLGGVLFINRNDGRNATQTLVNACGELLKKKAKLIIFPEGTRNREGDSFLPFKKGGFRVAITGQIPILPIVYSPYYFIDSERKIFCGGRIIIKALDPIPTVGLTIKDLDYLVDKTKKIMLEHYQLLKLEIESEVNYIKKYS